MKDKLLGEVGKVKWNHLWREVRHLFQRYVLRKEVGRGRFFITNITEPIPLFRKLIELGFQPNYFAYNEQGEIFNMRRLRYNGAELWQEHVRVFPDEVRGHFEITYEEDTAKHYNASTLQQLPSSTLDELLAVIRPSNSCLS